MGKRTRRQRPASTEAQEQQAAPWLDMRILAGACVAVGCWAVLYGAWAAPQPNLGPRIYSYEVVQEYPHDAKAFTQGLEHELKCVMSPTGHPIPECSDILWESTGMHGHSSVREVDLKSGKVLRQANTERQDFGEGLSTVGDKLVQLNWMTNKIYLFDKANLTKTEAKTPLKDGWGVTQTGNTSALVVSDGSDRLYWLDPVTLEVQRTLQVKDDMRPIKYLNELEWVEGEVWANVWQTECIARIDPKSGLVRGWMPMHGLRSRAQHLTEARIDVLNGVAYHAKTQRVFVTGKYWPTLFEVSIKPIRRNHGAAKLQDVRQQCIM